MNCRMPFGFALLLLAHIAQAAPSVSFVDTTYQPASGAPVAAQMGTLVVPESRRNPSEKTVSLKFVRFPSTSATPGPPIVYLAGGPGGSGIESARGTRFPLFMAMREFGDVIALDQRGTGISEPSLRCGEGYMIAFDKPLDRADAEAAMAGAMAQCFARLRAEGIDPNAYNTVESADDLNDLRIALGAEKLSLWGISYGSHLALATLRAHGETIDRAILAGIEPLDATLKLPSDQQALMEQIALRVAADSAFAKALPDMNALVAKLLKGLADEPARATLVHPANGQAIEVVLGPLDLQMVLAGMLTAPESFAAMPDLLLRLELGDWTALALQAGMLRMGRSPNAMSVAMDCGSGGSAQRLQRIADEAKQTLLGDAINMPFFGICAGLQVPDLGAEFRAVVHAQTPTLLISGTLDGRTPPHNATDAMAGLPNAVHLLIEGAGHSDPLFLSSPKILQAMQAFMRGETVSEAPIEVKVASFNPPRSVIELSAERLAAYAGEYELAGGDVRKLVAAGNLLYSFRGNGRPFPLRPSSEREFFWEGLPAQVQFELAEDGEVLAMLVDADGDGQGFERAAKRKENAE